MPAIVVRSLLLAVCLGPAALPAQRLAPLRPVAWYNDAGGITLGLRIGAHGSESSSRHTIVAGWSTGLASPHETKIRTPQFALTLRDPLPIPGSSITQRVELSHLDGVSSVGLGVRQGERFGAALRWRAVHDDRFLDPELWDVGGTLELPLWLAQQTQLAGWEVAARGDLTGAVEYRRPGGGITTARRYDMQPWLSGAMTIRAQRVVGAVDVRLRARHAMISAADPILPQRRLFVAGADPYQTLGNPFVRAAGAPLVRGEMAGHWHSVGGGNLRGFNAALSTTRLTTVNMELARDLVTTQSPSLARIRLVVFGDAGWLGAVRGIGGDTESLALRAPVKHFLMDAGIGLRGSHRIAGISFESRLELPLYVNDAPWAATATGERVSATRWLVGLSPVIP